MLHPQTNVDHDHLGMGAPTRKSNIAPGLQRNLAHHHHHHHQHRLCLGSRSAASSRQADQNSWESWRDVIFQLINEFCSSTFVDCVKKCQDAAAFVLLMMLWPKSSRSLICSQTFFSVNYFAFEFDCARLISEFVK